VSASAVGARPPASQRRRRWNRRVATITIATTASAIGVIVWFALNATAPDSTGSFPVVTTSPTPQYPVGHVDLAEPSAMAPPSATALAGYARTYVSDFTGATIPAGWFKFTGKPNIDLTGQFGARHVTQGGGLLRLSTWRDPQYANKWVGGGICQCGLARTYGAYFVRSRITANGPNEVQLLWPASNISPPEIDFNETGSHHLSTSWTIHWGTENSIDQRSLIIDMTKWHTWGVIWSPSAVIFTVDGRSWGEFTLKAVIANVPMTLDFEQLALCQSGRYCPTAPASMLIDWVAEYSPLASDTRHQ
jgi:hypothetical protein